MTKTAIFIEFIISSLFGHISNVSLWGHSISDNALEGQSSSKK